MTSEEMQKAMQFLLGQQAQADSRLSRLENVVAGLADAQVRAEQRWERTEGSIRALLAIAETHEREITALAEMQARLAESQARTDRQIAETNEQMAETNERLNALINTVERFISEGRNGKSQ